MLHRQAYVPAPIRTLLHSLDAALGACESLLQLPASDPHYLLRCELTAITHVLQAREHMREIQTLDGGIDGAVASQFILFLAVTDCLEDTTPAGYRATVPEAAAKCLIGGRIPIATLIALIAALRDVLDLFRGATGEEASKAAYQPASISEALVWATGPDAC